MTTQDKKITVHRTIDASAKDLFGVLSNPIATPTSTGPASSAPMTGPTASPRWARRSG